MKLGFYLFAEYINMFISSTLMATLYFGGYDIPFVNDANLVGHEQIAAGRAHQRRWGNKAFRHFFQRDRGGRRRPEDRTRQNRRRQQNGFHAADFKTNLKSWKPKN